MFCTSLRKQPEWAPIIPSLLSSRSPKFQERPLSTHDIAFPLSATPSATTTTNPQPAYLHFLLLTPTSLNETNRSETLARIDRLSTLTGNTKDIGIIFLLSNPGTTAPGTSTSASTPISTSSTAAGTHAFMELQLLLHLSPASTANHNPIPLLPLPSPQHLLPTLHHYTTTLSVSHSHSLLSTQTPHPNPQPNPARTLPLPPKQFTLTHLLPTTTTTYPPHPLPQHATYVLSDIAPSLRGVVEIVRSEGGRREVGGYVGEGVVAGMVEFWEGEWVVE